MALDPNVAGEVNFPSNFQGKDWHTRTTAGLPNPFGEAAGYAWSGAPLLAHVERTSPCGTDADCVLSIPGGAAQLPNYTATCKAGACCVTKIGKFECNP